MSKTNLFEVATRKGYRFQHKGLLSVEDLWQLPVKSLDTVYKVLKSQVKANEEESLLNDKTDEDEELNNKIEIVKYIVQVKLDEAKSREEAIKNKEQKQKIMEIMAAKRDEELRNMTADELQEMLNKLG